GPAASPRLKVAEALLALAAPAPAAAGALGAGGSATAARIRRLIAAPAPLGRARTAAGMATIAALAAFPIVRLAGPAAAASGMNCCPQTIVAATATARPGPCGTVPGCRSVPGPFEHQAGFSPGAADCHYIPFGHAEISSERAAVTAHP